MAALILASTAFAAGAPTIESESVSSVSATDAMLQAHVNVQETANGAYAQFQLVREESEFAPEILCPEPGPSGEICVGNRSATALPIQYLPANTMHPEAYDVASLDLNTAGVTLTPGTTYHWRLLVAPRVQTEDTIQWEEPTVFGATQTFTTPQAAAPAILGEGVSGVTSTDATLEATIEPRSGRNAFYQFQLVENPSEYGSEILCPPPPWPGFSACAGTRSDSALLIGWVCGECERAASAMPVHLDLASAGVVLRPGASYHFRVIAAPAVQTEDMIQWEPPPTYGADQTFTTSSEPSSTTQGGNPPSGTTGGQAPAGPGRHRRHHRHHRHHHRHHHRGRHR